MLDGPLAAGPDLWLCGGMSSDSGPEVLGRGLDQLEDLLRSVPTLDRAEQSAQLRALLPDLVPAPFDRRALRAWAEWDFEHGLLARPLSVDEAFLLNESG